MKLLLGNQGGISALATTLAQIESPLRLSISRSTVRIVNLVGRFLSLPSAFTDLERFEVWVETGDDGYSCGLGSMRGACAVLDLCAQHTALDLRVF